MSTNLTNFLPQNIFCCVFTNLQAFPTLDFHICLSGFVYNKISLFCHTFFMAMLSSLASVFVHTFHIFYFFFIHSFKIISNCRKWYLWMSVERSRSTYRLIVILIKIKWHNLMTWMRMITAVDGKKNCGNHLN